MNYVALQIDKKSLKYPKLIDTKYTKLVPPHFLELKVWMLIWFQIYTPIKRNL